MDEIIFRPSDGGGDDETTHVHLGEVSREALDAAMKELSRRRGLRIEKVGENEYVYHQKEPLGLEDVEKEFRIITRGVSYEMFDEMNKMFSAELLRDLEDFGWTIKSRNTDGEISLREFMDYVETACADAGCFLVATDRYYDLEEND